MTEGSAEAPGTGFIEANLPYSVDTGEKPVTETLAPGNIVRTRVGKYEDRRVIIRDGRAMSDEFTLDEYGFEFVRHETAVEDFFDADEIASVYYPEIDRLVKERTGATRVVIFDHTLRTGDEATRKEKLIREPVKSVHNDYTEWSAPQRVRDLLPAEEAEALLKGRFAVIQVWRAIRQPIESEPLAICDARSLVPEDMIAAERRYPDRVGETYRITYNPDHRWYYFPNMRRDEALVFKVYDSAKDGRARFTAHTSFDDPATPPDAAPRESIEVRALAFFDTE